MIPYILFIAVILVLYHYRKPKAMFVVMLLFSALRYDTGWDYMSYVELVDTTWAWNNPAKSRFSLFWCWIFSIAHAIHWPQFFIVVSALITYGALYAALKVIRLSRLRMVQILFIYIVWQDLYLASFSTMRQAPAMTLGLLAFAFLQRKQLWASIITVAAAVWLHSSAIILVVIYPVYYLRRYINFPVICIAALCSMVLLGSLAKIMSLISFIDMSHYAWYLKSQDNFGSKIILVYGVILSYLVFAFYSGTKWTLMERQAFLLSIFGLAGSIGVFAFGSTSVFSRIFSYTISFMILVLLPSMRIFKDRKLLTIATVAICSLYFLTYLIITQGGEKVASSPYVPYQCILFQ